MRILILGLTITSSWGNGHATTYRSLCQALDARGHEITFVEKDVSWYRDTRDLPQPSYCTLELYQDWTSEQQRLLVLARDADVVIIGSYFPDAIAAAELLFAADLAPVLFYDIDTPVTLAALRTHGRADYLLASQISHYQAYMSFTGGPILRELEERFGSPLATPLYCSVDPASHQRVPAHPEFQCDLSYLGTYAADRQSKLVALLNQPALALPDASFLVAGPMYPPEIAWAPNVRLLDHVPPPEHPAFYSSSRFTLNLTRQEMVAAGYSPSVRLFEAAACGAAIVSDRWAGIEEFLTPGEEILIVSSGTDVVDTLHNVSVTEAQRLGEAARARIFANHTSAHRAEEFEAIVSRVLATARSTRT